MVTQLTTPLTSAAFVERHIGARAQDTQIMLEQLGYSTFDELVDTAVPVNIRQRTPLDLPTACSEVVVLVVPG